MTTRAAHVYPFISTDIAGAITATGVRETKLREAINRGDLIVHYHDSKPVILAEDLRDWIASLPTERRSA